MDTYKIEVIADYVEIPYKDVVSSYAEYHLSHEIPGRVEKTGKYRVYGDWEDKFRESLTLDEIAEHIALNDLYVYFYHVENVVGESANFQLKVELDKHTYWLKEIPIERRVKWA